MRPDHPQRGKCVAVSFPERRSHGRPGAVAVRSGDVRFALRTNEGCVCTIWVVPRRVFRPKGCDRAVIFRKTEVPA